MHLQQTKKAHLVSYYSKIVPIQSRIPADRQGAKRHYGVHPYFTRRPYNVVRDYILHYSHEGDRVLDPFGGSGVTAIEAFLENRVGIQNDINPLANFVAQGIADLEKGDVRDYYDALSYLERKCKKTIAEVYAAESGELPGFSQRVPLPENITLPKTADVERYFDLFSARQLLSLALLKEAIEAIPIESAKRGMLLAWSATLAKLNKTFLSAKERAESRGGSSIFSIYRYKVAKKPIELPPWETFHVRAMNVIEANIELDKVIGVKKYTSGWQGAFEVYSDDVEPLSDRLCNSIDYIFTDPPYGGHIAYLDLSTLWNHWLGFQLDRRIRESEMIVGGELELGESYYITRLRRSIQACVRMLKPDRWFSIVFQHWNPRYFEAILSSAAESGAELKAAISQIGDPIWSMHKKKRKESVLAGELILTFYKTGIPTKVESNRVLDVPEIMREILRDIRDNKVYGEYLFNRMVLEAWRRAAIESLDVSRDDFIHLLRGFGWEYEEQTHCWIKGGKQPGLSLSYGG
jgi:16S rRNA G966 N2-methylase RsmD